MLQFTKTCRTRNLSFYSMNLSPNLHTLAWTNILRDCTILENPNLSDDIGTWPLCNTNLVSCWSEMKMPDEDWSWCRLIVMTSRSIFISRWKDTTQKALIQLGKPVQRAHSVFGTLPAIIPTDCLRINSFFEAQTCSSSATQPRISIIFSVVLLGHPPPPPNQLFSFFKILRKCMYMCSCRNTQLVYA